MVTTGIIFGILLARTISGALSDLAGWRSVFISAGAITLGLLPWLAHFVPRDERPPSSLRYVTLVTSTLALFAQSRELRFRAGIGFLVFTAIMGLSSGLVHSLLFIGAWLGAAKDVAQDAARIHLPPGRRATAQHAAQQAPQPTKPGRPGRRPASAQQAAQQTAQVHRRAAGVIALQGVEQRRGAVGLLRVVPQRPDQHRQRGGNGVAGGIGAGVDVAKAALAQPGGTTASSTAVRTFWG